MQGPEPQSDVSHGFRGGGALHSLASFDFHGFMSSQDKARMSGKPQTKTGDFEVGELESRIIVNNAGTTTATLPDPATNEGREISIKTIQAQAVISASSNVVPRIGGAAGTAILSASDGAWAVLVSDGTNWEIMQGS